ncbi:MAG: hypothetical protein ACYC6N_11345 [Pirellulaceae bacterium]
MGQMRFRATTPNLILPYGVAQAYIAGIEGIPWHSCNRWSEGILCLERAVTESGNLYIPCDVPGHGQLVLSSCTLMERAEPYSLETELARGTLHRVRALVAELESQQVAIPASVRAQVRQAVAAFIRAATGRTPGVNDDAVETIRIACDVIAALCQDVLLAQVGQRRAADGPLSALLVGRLDDPPRDASAVDAFLHTFHAASVPFRWRDLQPSADSFQDDLLDRQLAWCQAHEVRLLGGPLVQLDHNSLPDWVYRWEHHYDAFEDAARKYVRRVVTRCDEAVDVWVCAGRLNVVGALKFSEEQRLRLAVATIEAVRESSPRTPVVISFDQPWAEYMAAGDYDLSPLHFADALVRAELGVGGVALEMNLGYWPGGCLPRDLLAISRHLDRWSLLGIPLIVYLTMPSRTDQDPQAVGPARVLVRDAQTPEVPAMDQSLARYILPLLLSKPALHAVVWNQWSDADPHEFPHSGVWDGQGHAKPLWSVLTDIRKTLLT